MREQPDRTIEVAFKPWVQFAKTPVRSARRDIKPREEVELSLSGVRSAGVSARSPQRISVPQTDDVVFRYYAPAANSVKLAGDFTNGEHSPFAMRRSEDGFWQITVALYPGRYAYRFLVDGAGRDDSISFLAENVFCTAVEFS